MPIKIPQNDKLTLTSSRTTPLNQATGPHPEDKPVGQQYSGDICKTKGVSARSHLDMERGQLWLPWLYEDHQLWGAGCHVFGVHRYVPLLWGELE